MSKDKSAIEQEDKIESFVNDFVFNHLSQDVDFMSVVEAADEDEVELDEDELGKAHSDVNKLLKKIRDHIFKD